MTSMNAWSMDTESQAGTWMNLRAEVVLAAFCGSFGEETDEVSEQIANVLSQPAATYVIRGNS